MKSAAEIVLTEIRDCGNVSIDLIHEAIRDEQRSRGTAQVSNAPKIPRALSEAIDAVIGAFMVLGTDADDGNGWEDLEESIGHLQDVWETGE